jgi:adenylate kinase
MSTKRNNLIFVGGIYGVGKTTFCRRISAQYKIKYLSASKLIKDEKDKKALSRLKDERLTDENIDQNQNHLMSAYGDMQHIEWEILDGHFCLINSENIIRKLPAEIYRLFMPQLIVVVIDEIKIIQKRLLERDKKLYNLKMLETFQIYEMEHAMCISKLVDAQIIISNMAEESSTMSQIENLLKESSTGK